MSNNRPSTFSSVSSEIDRVAHLFMYKGLELTAQNLRNHFLAELGEKELHHYRAYLQFVKSWYEAKNSMLWVNIMDDTAAIERQQTTLLDPGS